MLLYQEMNLVTERKQTLKDFSDGADVVEGVQRRIVSREEKTVATLHFALSTRFARKMRLFILSTFRGCQQRVTALKFKLATSTN